jgi:hypothetical protein
MGGFGSGRHGRTVTSEGTASYVIAASMVIRAGRGVTGVARFDGGSFWVAIRVDISHPSDAFIELTHQTRDERKGDRIVRDRIRLVSTVPTYGGRRWWFQCPRTRRRTTKLFLPNGGWHFWSRQAHDLGYACQREECADRFRRKAAKLNRQLGGAGWDTWQMPPDKPKWMRWRTYETKLKVWEEAVEKANTELIARAMMGLKRRKGVSDERSIWP